MCWYQGQHNIALTACQWHARNIIPKLTMLNQKAKILPILHFFLCILYSSCPKHLKNALNIVNYWIFVLVRWHLPHLQNGHETQFQPTECVKYLRIVRNFSTRWEIQHIILPYTMFNIINFWAKLVLDHVWAWTFKLNWLLCQKQVNRRKAESNRLIEVNELSHVLHMHQRENTSSHSSKISNPKHGRMIKIVEAVVDHFI